MVFHRSLNDSKSSQASRTRFSILPDLCNLYGVNYSSDFYFFQFPLQFSENRSKCTESYWHHLHPHITPMLSFYDKNQVFVYIFAIYYFHFVVRLNSKIHKTSISLYFYLFIYFVYIRGSLNKFPDFFRMVTFIDSTHMKLLSPSKYSPPAAMHLFYRSNNSWKAP